MKNPTFTYQPSVPGYTQSGAWLPPVALDNATGGDTGVRLLDVNNDGFADLLQGAQRTSTKAAWLNNHNAGWTNTTAWAPPVYFTDNAGNDTGVRFADVNNDGLVDLLVSKAGTSQVWLNNGTNWTLSSWTIPVDFVNSAGQDQGVVLADVDGDGRVDLVRAKNGAPGVVYRNTGTGWTNVSWSVPTTFNNGTSDTGARLLDVNGDGLPDLVQANGSNSRTVWLNNGAGWTLSTWTVPVDFTNKTYQDTGVRFLDVDSDGLPDLVQNLINKTITINNTWLNNGTGWTLNNTWQVPAAMVANQSNVGRRIADLNADGQADLLTGANGTLQNPWLKNPGNPYLLATITNEYGGTVTINYTTSTQYNNTGGNGAGMIGFNIPVVQAISKNNSINGPQAVLGFSNYSYRGGQYNYTKREFRGFSTTTEQTPAAVITHAFYQDAPRRGKEYSTTINDLDGTRYQTTIREYNYTYLYGIYNLSLRSITQSEYDGASIPRTTSTLYTYDWFGNPLVITEQGDIAVTGDERTTTYTYAYNKNNWILNRPARITVTDALGDNVKETTNYYDNQGLTGIGSHGSLTRTESWNNHGNNTLMQYEYDDYGNLLRSTDSAGATTQFAYDTMNHRLAAVLLAALVASIPLTLAAELHLTYDANGNLVTGDGKYRTYNSLNQLSAVYNGTNSTGTLLETYLYHPTEERILKKVSYNADGTPNTTTYYITQTFVRVVSGTNITDFTYVYHNGALVAQSANGAKLFMATDHKGTISIVTNSSGDVVERDENSPFGEALNDSVVRYGYEGKEADSLVGDTDFKARMYKAHWAMFTAPDSTIQKGFDPQNLNRYSFERNNPTNNIDPTGHFFAMAVDVSFATDWTVFPAAFGQDEVAPLPPERSLVPYQEPASRMDDGNLGQMFKDQGFRDISEFPDDSIGQLQNKGGGWQKWGGLARQNRDGTFETLRRDPIGHQGADYPHWNQAFYKIVDGTARLISEGAHIPNFGLTITANPATAPGRTPPTAGARTSGGGGGGWSYTTTNGASTTVARYGTIAGGGSYLISAPHAPTYSIHL